eukprot:g18949.t1
MFCHGSRGPQDFPLIFSDTGHRHVTSLTAEYDQCHYSTEADWTQAHDEVQSLVSFVECQPPDIAPNPKGYCVPKFRVHVVKRITTGRSEGTTRNMSCMTQLDIPSATILVTPIIGDAPSLR